MAGWWWADGPHLNWPLFVPCLHTRRYYNNFQTPSSHWRKAQKPDTCHLSLSRESTQNSWKIGFIFIFSKTRITEIWAETSMSADQMLQSFMFGKNIISRLFQYLLVNMVFIVHKMSCDILPCCGYPAILNYSPVTRLQDNNSRISDLSPFNLHDSCSCNYSRSLPWYSHLTEPDQSSDVVGSDVEMVVVVSVGFAPQETHVRVSPNYLCPGLPPGLHTPPAGLWPLPSEDPPEPAQGLSEIVWSQVHQCTRCTRSTALQRSYPLHHQGGTEHDPQVLQLTPGAGTVRAVTRSRRPTIDHSKLRPLTEWAIN